MWNRAVAIYSDEAVLTSAEESFLTVLLAGSAILGVLNPAFWVVSIALLYPMRHKVSGIRLEQDKAIYFYWPQLLGLVAMMVAAAPWAPDDLLRSVVAGKVGYDYRQLYIGTSIPKLDLWYGYDRLLAYVSSLIGPVYTVRLIQFAGGAALVYALTAAIRQELAARDDKWLWSGLAVTLLFATPVVGRIVCGRPEVFFASYALLALTMRPMWWTLLGLALAPFYWLSPIYAVAGLMLNTSWRTRIVTVLIVTVGTVIIWTMISNGAWFDMFPLMKQWMHNRLTRISENAPLLASIRNPVVVALLALAYIGVKSRRSPKNAIPLLAVIAWFCLPNMVRYVGVILPICMVLAARYLAHSQFKVTPSIRQGVMVAGIGLIVYAGAGQRYEGASFDDAAAFKLPPGAKLLTAYDASVYSMTFNNPRAQYFASYELGANSLAAQRLQIDLQQENKLDCDAVKRIGATHVVERYLKEVPSCLHLEGVNKNWRFWRVINGPPIASSSAPVVAASDAPTEFNTHKSRVE